MKALKFASILACLSVAHLTAMEKQYDQQVQPSRATQKSQGPSLLDAYLLLTLRETPLPVVDAMNLDEPNTDGILRVTNGEFVMPVPAKVPAQEESIVIEEELLDLLPSAEEQFQTTDRASMPLRDYEIKLAQLIETLGIERTDLGKEKWINLATRLQTESQYTFSSLQHRLRNLAKNHRVTPRNKDIYIKLASTCGTLYFQSVNKTKRLSESLRDFEVELANHIKSLGIQETDMDAKSWEELAVRLGNISQKAFSTLKSQLAKMSRNHNLDAADKQIYRMLSNACFRLYHHKFPDRDGESHTPIDQQQDQAPQPAGAVEDAMDLDVDLAAEEREDKSSGQEDYDVVRLVPLAGPKTKLSLAGFNRELILTYLDKDGFREFMHPLDEAFAKLTFGCGLKNFEQYTDALSGLVDFEYHKLRVFVGTSKSTFAYVYNFPYVMDTGEELLLHYHPHKKGDDFAGWSVLSRIVKEKRPQRILKDTNEELIRSIVDELGLVEVHDNLENRDWEQHLKLISEKTGRTLGGLCHSFKEMRGQTDEYLESAYYAIFQKLMNAAERLNREYQKSAPLQPHQHDLVNHVALLQINEGNHDAETWKKWATTLQEKTGKGFGTLTTQLIVLASNSHVLEPYKSIYVKLGNAGQSIYRKQHSKGLKRKRSEDRDSSEPDPKRQQKG